ncbi:MAG: tetratricopeptide repeat protein [Saprospiraceae bacterium]
MFILLAVMAIMISSCATKKRKDEVSGFKKFYHTFTSKYNGYFNANELMEESFAALETSRQDNYNQILPIYTYTDVDNPKMVASQLDLAIEKVIRVATIHELGEYVDDCYVLMGKAQYLKQDYETAQETFEFFQEEFNPANPYGSNYKKKKKSIKQKKRDRDIEKENQKELKKKEKEEKEEQREKDRKEKEKLKKEAKKAKEEGRKKRKKEKKEEEKRRKKEREDRKKSNKRSKKSGGKKKRVPKDEKEKEETESIIEVEETKVDLVKNEANSDVESELNLMEEDQKEVAVSEDVGEEEVIPKKKKEKKEDDTAYSEGMLWLAKTYIERGKYSNAEYLLRKLSQSMVKKEVEREIPVAKSYLYMVQKEYDKAIPELRKAIDVSNDGKLKARYAYIIAQLYQKKNDYASALSAFQEVKDHKGNFRMDFNADLSIAKNGLLAGTESNELASEKINKMLGEEKYSEFRDQIYFTLGEISLAQNNDKEALINFTLSIRNNLNNPPLKSEAYYYMATLNFEKEEYVAAKYYYDSTLMSMNKLDERYNEVSLYTKNLSRIARNIETIELQDSLLFLSGLSQEKLDKLADMLVLEQRAADEEVEKNKSKGKTSQPKMGSGRQNSRKRGFGNSKFFAYNLAAKEKGANEFRKRWGDRKLEDNWRRLDSQSFNTFDDEDVEEEEEKEITDAERKRALVDVPSTPASLEKANAAIEEALYDLGVAFRGAVKNYQKSVDALEKLVVRYPQSEKILDVYYYLYLSYSDLGNSNKAEYYKNRIIQEFPDSRFAKALQDPNYFASLKDENNSVELYYDNTYELFDNGKYINVKNRIAESEALFGKENAMKAKFSLLSAMVTGAEEGKEGYIKSLQDVITRHPDTPQQIRAQEIMRFLKGDSDAFEVVEIKEVDDIFDLEEDKLHYVAIVVYESDNEKFTDAKIAVSNFNKRYYRTKKLQISDIFLNRDEGSQIILIRKFKNMKESMDYYDTVEKNKVDYIKGTEIAFDVYPITQRNYRKIISERSASKYRVFFQKNYKKK